MPHASEEGRKAYQREYVRQKRAKFGRPSRSKYGLPYTPLGDRETIRKRKEQKEALIIKRRLERQAEREIKLQYLATPEGIEEQKRKAADKSRHRYSTSLLCRLMQKEKRQRNKFRDSGNWVMKIPQSQLINRCALFGNCCAYCGSYEGLNIQLEHVIPKSRGGAHCLSNIIPACHSCNQSKRAQDMSKWYKQQPFYSYERLKRIKHILSSTPYPSKQTELFHDWQIGHHI
jgi:5-methylcytosine-specific restriction endonuclease McrA|tara:strand:+ start:2683 stop:3375 length:693 start_codon:yes stop_codon:yes gene_type:complete